jgi:hypothetical protein
MMNFEGTSRLSGPERAPAGTVARSCVSLSTWKVAGAPKGWPAAG